MRYFLRFSVGLVATAGFFVAGCGQPSPLPQKPAASPTVALHLTAGPVRVEANGKFKVVLIATGQQVGETYTLSASGAGFASLGGPALGTREGSSWSVEYVEEGTSGRSKFVLTGPVPSASPGKSNTVVVTW